MAVRKNIIANYLGTTVTALAPVLALPWYLSALGTQQFGLIAFITLMQAVLGLLDSGLAQALVSEFAVRFDMTKKAQLKTATLLLGFERIYWLFSLLVGAVVWLFSGLIAARWLNLGDMPVSTGRIAIEGAAALFAAQFPGSVYRSLLVGAQAQVPLNAVLTVGALLKHFGAVIAVTLLPSLITYVAWHAGAALLETLARRTLAWRLLRVQASQVRCDTFELLQVWRTIAGLSGAALLGALTVQMDKIVLSRVIPLDQFGFYSVASSLAVGVLLLISPLVQAVLPRAIQLRSQPAALRHLSLKLAGLIGATVCCGALVFYFAGHWLLTLWLKNAVAVSMIYPLLAVLLVGTALNAFYNVGYVHWLVHQNIRRILQVNLLAFVLAVAVIPPLVAWRGSMGATFGWLVINLIGFLLSLEWIGRKPNEKHF